MRSSAVRSRPPAGPPGRPGAPARRAPTGRTRFAARRPAPGRPDAPARRGPGPPQGAADRRAGRAAVRARSRQSRWPPTPAAPTPPPDARRPHPPRRRRHRRAPADPADPAARRGIDAGPRDPAEHDPAVQAAGPAARWTARRRTRCAATTTRRCRWSACNQDGTEKYVLGPSFLEGTQIDTALAAAEQPGRRLGHQPDLQERAAPRSGATTRRRTSARTPRSCWTARSSPRRRSTAPIYGDHRRSPASSARPRRSTSPACCATGRCRCRSSRPRRRPSRPPSGSPRCRPA